MIHINGDNRVGDRIRHVTHITMTGNALDLSNHRMALMGEVELILASINMMLSFKRQSVKKMTHTSKTWLDRIYPDPWDFRM